MLSKTKGGLFNYYNNTTSFSSNNNTSTGVSVEYTIIKDGDYFIEMGVHGTSGYKYQIKVNNTVVSSYENSGGNSKGDYTYIANGLKVGDVISFVVIARASGWNSIFDYGRVSLILTKPENKGPARSLALIGGTSYITLYGIHTDEVFYGGVIQDKSSTATTGSLTLGNAVGFLTVSFNGEILKIPYYNN